VESQEQGPPNGRSEGNGGAPTFGDRARKVSHSAEHAFERARDGVTELRDTLDLPGRANRHPYGTVAAALGIGYVLGGGLFSPLTGRIVGLGLRVGLRLALLPLLKDEIIGVIESMGDEGAEHSGGGAGRPRARSAKAKREQE
jgi:hypothetical protein